MKRRRTSREAAARALPRWAWWWCGVLVALFWLHGALPLMHEAASHADEPACGGAIATCDGHRGDPGAGGAHGEGAPVNQRGACEICRELILVKQVIPWQAPLMLVLPERRVPPVVEIASSRPLDVWRRSAPARGPPARA